VALRALREVTLLRVINYPKVIKIYEILPPKDEKNFQTLAVALEYLPMDLKKVCEKVVQLDDLHIEWILYQMLCALKYLKSAKILHRDLKP
jgi:serine/threonine protein kinase